MLPSRAPSSRRADGKSPLPVAHTLHAARGRRGRGVAGCMSSRGRVLGGQRARGLAVCEQTADDRNGDDMGDECTELSDAPWDAVHLDEGGDRRTAAMVQVQVQRPR